MGSEALGDDGELVDRAVEEVAAERLGLVRIEWQQGKSHSPGLFRREVLPQELAEPRVDPDPGWGEFLDQGRQRLGIGGQERIDPAEGPLLLGSHDRLEGLLRLGLLAAHEDRADEEGHDRRSQEHRAAGRERLVSPGPPGQARHDRFVQDADRLVGQPALDVVRQGTRGHVTPSRVFGHRLQAGRLEAAGAIGTHLPRWRETAGPHLLQDDRWLGITERRPARQQVIERGAQTIHVAGRPDRGPSGLLGAHVGRGPEGRARLRHPVVRGRGGIRRAFLPGFNVRNPGRLGQPPVDHDGLAVGAQHDVGRLDVAMDNSVRVGILNDITYIDEASEELPEGQRPLARRGPRAGGIPVEPRDGIAERLAPDQPHDVIRAAFAVMPEAVHGDDPRVFQPPGDLGLPFEAGSAHGVVGEALLDLLECDFTPQFRVVGHVDIAQPTLGVRAEDAEALGGPSGGRHAPGRGAVGLGGGDRSRAHVCQRGVDHRVIERGQALEGGAVGREVREAPLGVAAVLLQMLGDELVQQGALPIVQVAPIDEMVGQGTGLVAGPGLEGGDELDLVDQADLQGEETEEEMSVGIGCHERASRPRRIRWSAPLPFARRIDQIIVTRFRGRNTTGGRADLARPQRRCRGA